MRPARRIETRPEDLTLHYGDTMLNGHAIGIGLTLALQADLRVAAQDAKYAVPHTRRGVVGDCMSHRTLQRAAALSERLLWQTTAGRYGPQQGADLEARIHERLMGQADRREGVSARRERQTECWSASVSREMVEIPEPDSGR